MRIKIVCSNHGCAAADIIGRGAQCAPLDHVTYDVLGTSASSELLATMVAFHDANPVLCKTVFAALEEAVKISNQGKLNAARIHVEEARAKAVPGDIENLISAYSGAKCDHEIRPTPRTRSDELGSAQRNGPTYFLPKSKTAPEANPTASHMSSMFSI
jgi:hypothetical protein